MSWKLIEKKQENKGECNKNVVWADQKEKQKFWMHPFG